MNQSFQNGNSVMCSEEACPNDDGISSADDAESEPELTDLQKRLQKVEDRLEAATRNSCGHLSTRVHEMHETIL